MSREQPAIELVIDELILHGFPSSQRQRIGYALEQELTRLLNERGIPAALMQSSTLPRINGGAFQVARHDQPEMIGRQIAHTVYSSLSSSSGQRTQAAHRSNESGMHTENGPGTRKETSL